MLTRRAKAYSISGSR